VTEQLAHVGQHLERHYVQNRDRPEQGIDQLGRFASAVI
jgi:hypothetical protein